MTKHKIDIRKPIWKKPRSIELNIAGFPVDDQVEISISYKNKDDKLLYPDTWLIEIKKLAGYPIQKVQGGVLLNIIPIEDLYKLSITPKTENMIFDKKFINSTIEASKNATGSKTKIAPGKHILTITKVEIGHAKSDNNPMVIIEFEKDEDHWPLREYFKIEGKNTDISRKKLIGLFHKGFGYEIKACKTEDDLLKQLIKFEGKDLAVAVKGQTKAISVSRGDSTDMIEIVDPGYWYCTTTSDIDSLEFDMGKAVSGLSDQDKEKIIQFKEMTADPEPEPEPDNTEEAEFVASTDDDDDDEAEWFDQ